MKNNTLLLIIGLIIFILFIFHNKINSALGMTRGYRNNNPGNIRKTYDSKGNITYWKGEIPGTDQDFKTFATMADGYRAMFVLINTYVTKGYNTINKIISRYAPNNENNTTAYINSVSDYTGIDKNTPLNISDPKQFKNLIAAISYHENGIEPNENDISNGYKLF